MDFYPSKNNDRLNGDPFAPETVNGRAMVNPLYPVTLAPGTDADVDSAAFQECAPWERHTPWYAMERQRRFAGRIAATSPGTRFTFFTYDRLTGVDEAIDEQGRRVKRRGTRETAAEAVRETLVSARHYHARRDRLPGGIAYACQGIDPAQYAECAEQLIPLIDPARGDLFAFGGFCIVGLKPALKPVLYETLAAVLPRLARAGIPRAHILGVTVADAIAEAARIARPYGVRLSTDSSGPERNAAIYGREFVTDGPRGPRFTARWSKADKFTRYRPAAWAMEQIARYDAWCQTLQPREEPARCAA